MKKLFSTFKFLTFILMLTAITVFACDSADVMSASQDEVVGIQESTEQRVAKSSVPTYMFTGAVQFWNKASANEFALFWIDSGKYHYLLFDGGGTVPAFTNGNYHLELHDHGLVIYKTTSPTITYYVGMNTANSSALLADLDDTITFTGTKLTTGNLIHYFGPPAMFDNTQMSALGVSGSPYQTVASFIYRAVVAADCDSEGFGAISCQAMFDGSGCSVTCYTGHYACCNAGSSWSDSRCRCIAF